MPKSTTWFVIVNPSSGNGLGKQKWPLIESILTQHGFSFKFSFTKNGEHCKELCQNAINQGFKNIIGVGGDGTLHYVLNGIMSQNFVPSSSIKVGVIPVGTGNDWIKTHQIPNNIEQAILLIKNNKTKQQDIGKIVLKSNDNKPVYFLNLAGIGFDGYVVSKVGKYKHFGAVAYLLGTIMGLFSFKNFNSKVIINSQIIESKTKMILIGLCTFSGGGMLLTKDPNPYDGLFDVSIVKNISKIELVSNLKKLFNGTITNHSKVETFKTRTIKIDVLDDNSPFIQADGELIGKGGLEISLIPEVFTFFC